MSRRALPLLLVALLSTGALAQPTQRQLDAVNALTRDLALEGPREIRADVHGSGEQALKTLRVEFPEEGMIFQHLRFPSTEAALASLHLGQAGRDSLKMTAVFGRDLVSWEQDFIDYDQDGFYSAREVLSPLRVLLEPELGWLRVRLEDGKIGYVALGDGDVEVDLNEAWVEAPFVVARERPSQDGRALRVLDERTILPRDPHPMRTPDALLMSIGDSSRANALLSTDPDLEASWLVERGGPPVEVLGVESYRVALTGDTSELRPYLGWLLPAEIQLDGWRRALANGAPPPPPPPPPPSPPNPEIPPPPPGAQPTDGISGRLSRG